jgi:calcineurin-like phosphoesterase family protein
MKTFLISDTHFDHKMIMEYEPSRQQFGDRFDMTEAIIERWNETVGPNDLVFHLGDVFFCGAKRAEEIASRLNGRKILIDGNHDGMSRTKYRKLGFESFKYYFVDDLFLSHYPQHDSAIRSAIENGAIIGNVHGHVHSDITGLDQSIYKCVSVELIDYRPIPIEEIKTHFKLYKVLKELNYHG